MSKQRLPDDELQAATPEVAPEDAQAIPDDELFADPTDFSAVGGPESEPAYGRNRALAGEYPFNPQGGPRDRDEPSHLDRGGIQNQHHVMKRP